jgi:hypothetical protein
VLAVVRIVSEQDLLDLGGLAIVRAVSEQDLLDLGGLAVVRTVTLFVTVADSHQIMLLHRLDL